MDSFGKQSRFEIKPIIEQKPFENKAVQSFFTKWCEINDSIEPEIISRAEWEKIEKKEILEREIHGKRKLFIPSDLQLWEMIGVMEVMDSDTFIKKPERQTEAKKEMLELGKNFR